MSEAEKKTGSPNQQPAKTETTSEKKQADTQKWKFDIVLNSEGGKKQNKNE